MDIEKIAVNTVALALSKSDYLKPNIHSEDKELSWDGDIEVYKKAGSMHSKSDLDIKIPVQVKGKVSNQLNKTTICYPVQISDMQNYLCAGGTVYFVVYINPSGDETQTYYAPMLPFELKKILGKYGAQRTRQIQMKALPKDKDELTNVFLCFAYDMKKQKAAISSRSVTMEDLKKDGSLKKISIGYTTVPQKYSTPFDYLFDHDAYIYAPLPHGIELPVEHLEKIEAAGTKLTASVMVNGKLFYIDYGIVYKKGITELHFGKSTTFIIEQGKNRYKFSFSLKGTLSERIKDLEFVIEILTVQQFNVGSVVWPLKGILPGEIETFNLLKLRESLEWLMAVKETLDTLCVKDDLDCSKLTKDNEHNLMMLKTAILDKQAISLKGADAAFGVFNIANLKILVCTLMHDEKKKLFNVYGFNDAPLSLKVTDKRGKEYPSSIYVILTKTSFLNCCNIDYEAMLEDIKRVPFSEMYSNQLNQLFLQMLSAYDESSPSRKDILEAALILSEWLKNNDPYSEQDILTLNYYQVIKRKRSLEPMEIRDILLITENQAIREELYVGAYILLDNYAAAKIHFDLMPSETQEIFRTYPIFHLWEQYNREA